jgi:hypothetical protein
MIIVISLLPSPRGELGKISVSFIQPIPFTEVRAHVMRLIVLGTVVLVL